ncbi:MAG: hypothetical protein LBT46_08880 [Planctomycetaceae bacterium]|nr:hypothetical protein [Planctomycetaceae bacterium]
MKKDEEPNREPKSSFNVDGPPSVFDYVFCIAAAVALAVCVAAIVWAPVGAVSTSRR